MAKPLKRRLTEEEIALCERIIAKQFVQHGAIHCANVLTEIIGHIITEGRVNKIACELKLPGAKKAQAYRPWTPEEIELLKENFNRPIRELKKLLKRTDQAILKKKARLMEEYGASVFAKKDEFITGKIGWPPNLEKPNLPPLPV